MSWISCFFPIWFILIIHLVISVKALGLLIFIMIQNKSISILNTGNSFNLEKTNLWIFLHNTFFIITNCLACTIIVQSLENKLDLNSREYLYTLVAFFVISNIFSVIFYHNFLSFLID